VAVIWALASTSEYVLDPTLEPIDSWDETGRLL
jgi:hypothetical protein